MKKNYEDLKGEKIFYKRHGIKSFRKVIAIFISFLFIFSGIPMPASFAVQNNLALGDKKKATPVIAYDPSVTAQGSASNAATIPSGAAIQETSALSPATSQKSETSQAKTQSSGTSIEQRTAEISSYYNDYLGRAGSKEEIAGWVYAPLSLDYIKQQFLISQERQNDIAGFYRDYVNREGSSEDILWWAQQDMKLVDIKQQFLISTERQGYIAGYYRDYLGREGSSQDILWWAQQDIKLTDIKQQFLVSQERQTKINGYYQTYLGRDGSSADVLGWAQQDKKLSDVKFQIMTSQERQNRINEYCQIYLGRNGTSQELLNYAQQDLSYGLIETQIVQSQERKNIVSQNFKQSLGYDIDPTLLNIWCNERLYTMAHINSFIDQIKQTQSGTVASPSFYFTTYDIYSMQWYLVVNGQISPLPNSSNYVRIQDKFSLDGKIYVKYSGAPQMIVVDGHPAMINTTYYQSYDITTKKWTQLTEAQWLQLQAWTPSASNPNYAYKITNYVDGTAMSHQKLEIKNSTTGEILVVSDVINGTIITKVDASPDGKYFVVGYQNGQGNVWADVLASTSQQPIISINLDSSGIQSIEFKSNQIWIHTKNYDYLADTQARTSVRLYPLPSGFTRAASNVFYAFQYQTRSNEDVLILKDLKTGTTTEIRKGNYPLRIDQGTYDVSPDGTSVIFGTTNGTQSSVYVRHIANPSEELSFSGKLQSISYEQNGQMAVLNMKKSDGSTGTIRVSLPDLKVAVPAIPLDPAVPEGWTRAVSNVNFAFQVQTGHAGPYVTSTLKVKNLLTGEEKTIAQTSQESSMLGPNYDVTPDGQYVVYSINYMPASNYTCKTYFKKISDGTTALTLDGQLKALSVQGKVPMFQMSHAYSDGTELQSAFSVDFSSLQQGPSTYTLVKQGSGWTIDDQAKLAVFTKTGYQIPTQLMIFDTTKGTNQMTLLASPSATSSYPGDYVSFVNIHITSTGKGIVSYSSNQIYAQENQSVVLDPRTGQQVTMAGQITAASYSGDIANYNLKLKDGKEVTQKVDLGQMKIVAASTLPQLAVGQFQSGGCLVPNQSSGTSSSSCVGLIGTPTGTMEIHAYNQRGNTGITIYNGSQSQIGSYPVPSFNAKNITAASFSKDGKYLAVPHQVNKITVIPLTGGAAASISVPQAPGCGSPTIGKIEFQSSTRALVTMKDGSGRKFWLDIGPNNKLTLTIIRSRVEPYPAGKTR